MNKLALICLALIAIQLSFSNAEEIKKVDMRKVEKLSLRNDTLTVGFKIRPMPQNTCISKRIGDDLCTEVKVSDTVICKNSGFRKSPQENGSWSCHLDTNANRVAIEFFRFTCEYLDDAKNWAIEGSCHTEYTLRSY